MVYACIGWPGCRTGPKARRASSCPRFHHARHRLAETISKKPRRFGAPHKIDTKASCSVKRSYWEMHDPTPAKVPTAVALPASSHAAAEYGRLEERNIDTVSFGELFFETWYGNSAYFLKNGDEKLGIDLDLASSRRRGYLPIKPGFWIDHLYVCDTCFKYTTNPGLMAAHRPSCALRKSFPPIGKLVYLDLKLPYIIKKIRGFRHPVFCQNLALFGKLFLDDKSVFYNVEAFDFYVIYGQGFGAAVKRDPAEVAAPLGLAEQQAFRPMGFFSKEVNSWEVENNLACICIFPPFQRLGLGSLLIEFLYALARVTPGQLRLGPEFPLSPFGKVLYLRFWARRLAFLILNDLTASKTTTLEALAEITGFRKEDILMTLEFMGVLQRGDTRSGAAKAEATLLWLNTVDWCEKNGVDAQVLGTMLDPESLLI